MKQEYKQPWIDALKSGKYKKGRNNLRRGDKFCCLGVLLDINGYEWEIIGLRNVYCLNVPPHNSGLLTDEQALAFGLTPMEVSTLAQLNDVARKPFRSIAKWIKENL